MAHATAKLTTEHGNKGFNLFLMNPDKPYGFYHLGESFDATSQIQEALNDAEDYNMEGIIFTK